MNTPNRLIVVIQEKGGVWKTFIAVHLVAYLRSIGVNYRPVDFDKDTGIIAKIYPEAASIRPDVGLLASGESSLPLLMDKALAGERFLFDCGSNTSDAWEALLAPQGYRHDLVEGMRQAGLQITLVVPVNNDPKSIKSFISYRAIFPGATLIMVVIRKYPNETFALPPHPAELTISIPEAPGALFSAYLQMAMSIDQLAASKDSKIVAVSGYAKGYLPKIHAAFNTIKKHLT